MTKMFNFPVKIKGGGVVGRVGHAKSPPPKKFGTCTWIFYAYEFLITSNAILPFQPKRMV